MFDLADEEVVAYRGLSALAVVGPAGRAAFAAGVFRLELLAAAAVGASVASRDWRCGGSPSQAPNLVGRKAALAGLLLGVTFLVAAPTSAGRLSLLHSPRGPPVRRPVDRGRPQRRRAGRPRNDRWIPRRRTRRMRRWPAYYSQSDYHKKMLDLFKSQAVIRTLFALGRSAEYRYYETAEEGGQEDGGDYVKVHLRRNLRGRAASGNRRSSSPWP